MTDRVLMPPEVERIVIDAGRVIAGDASNRMASDAILVAASHEILRVQNAAAARRLAEAERERDEAYKRLGKLKAAMKKALTNGHGKGCAQLRDFLHPCDCWRADAFAALEKKE